MDECGSGQASWKNYWRRPLCSNTRSLAILGHYLTVQQWNPHFDSSNDNIDNIVARIRLLGMPLHYYHKRVLRMIGNVVGKVIRIDYNTESLTRGKFARIAVEVSLNKPLCSQFFPDGKMQKVEYENLPVICFNCGIYGHKNENCPQLKTIKGATKNLENNGVGNITNSGGDKPWSSTVIPANPSLGPWMTMIVSRKGRGKSTMVVFSGGSRFEVLENEDNEDRGFPSLHDKNGHSTEKDQSAIQFKFRSKKNPKNPTIINSHANVNSPAMQTPSYTTAKYSFLNVNPISEMSTPIFVHAEALSRAQSKNPATSSNLPVPTAIPTSLDPVKHTAIKFLPPHDFHSDPKDISLDPTRPNKELADPNIPIDDRDKPPDKDLEMDANDEDDPDDKSFKDKGEKSDSESDDSGTSLEDEDNMESE
ncbi:hypothetical protein WN944_024020 [Citrus x changshan-huyou]|uniref:CCHC-type domain-containing protein n=1 Tax=Citrus x changshan-huyou TaxID=2935761 RepID=A0AAP0LN47_9ROSI